MLSGEAENHENSEKRSNDEGQRYDQSSGKRRRLVDDSGPGFTDNQQPITVLKQLTHEDYTVGWICALALELTAARAMLDEEHAPLSIPLDDPNSYIYGEICGNNIVLTCLQVQYTTL